jgi:hypothetical protein
MTFVSNMTRTPVSQLATGVCPFCNAQHPVSAMWIEVGREPQMVVVRVSVCVAR